MATGGGQRAIIAAAVANGGIAIAKFIAFLVTGASSMLAESIHSVADTSNQGLLLLGSKRAQRDATPEHAFGYGRERYFWSFVVALILFTLGGLFALYEGFSKLKEPHELESPQWAIGVLIFGIVLEGFSFRTAVVESNHIRGERSWAEFIRTSKTPELPVVLLEDLGAMIGLVAALIGVGLAIITDNPIFDALGTMVIGTLLVLIAIVLAIEMKSLLIGESVSAETQRKIDTAVGSVPQVRRIIHMRTQYLGPEELLIAAKIELDPGLTVREATEVIDLAETQIREVVPVAEFVYLEPDEYEAAQVEA